MKNKLCESCEVSPQCKDGFFCSKCQRDFESLGNWNDKTKSWEKRK